MTDRALSFGDTKLTLLDKIIYALRVHQIRKYCSFDHKHVVDAGCGKNAVFLQYIKRVFSPKSLTAFDLTLDNSLQKMGIICQEGDLNKDFSFQDTPDIILSTAVLEHLLHPEVFLKNVYRNLSSGGVLILTVPTVWSKPVLEFLAYKLHIISEYEIRDHKKYYDKKSLEKVLIRAGFSVENIHHHYFEIFMNNFVLVKK